MDNAMVSNRLIRQRGDTLVEVLMAIVILSLVVVGAITLMTRGIESSQAAVEHTEVRLNINAQNEMLRYLRDGYLTDPQSPAGQTWLSLLGGTSPYANTTQSVDTSNCTVTTGKTGFYLMQNGNNVTVQAFNSSTQPTTVATAGAGLWVEATRSANGISPAYVDFQLRGCWTTPGSAVVQQTITVERLYDPAH